MKNTAQNGASRRRILQRIADQLPATIEDSTALHADEPGYNDHAIGLFDKLPESQCQSNQKYQQKD